jgi:hypothetical protein
MGSVQKGVPMSIVLAEATLPKFEAKRSQDFPAFLVVFCPRDDCPGTAGGRPFLVAEREWLRPFAYKTSKGQVRITGRSCPYCFRAARLPRRSEVR